MTAATRSPRLSLVLLLLASALSGCGGGDPQELTDQGYAALGSNDAGKAAGLFEEALAKIGSDTAHAQYLRAKMGMIEAIAVANPRRAREDFLALAAARPEDVTDRDYNRIALRVAEGDLKEAIELARRGMEAHAESPHLAKLVQDLGKRAETSGDPAELEALKSLGYVGGD